LQLLFDTLIERSSKIFLSVHGASLADFCHYFPKEVDRVYLFGADNSAFPDVPVILKIITSRHPLGQQRIMILNILSRPWAEQMMDAIIKVKQQNLHNGEAFNFIKISYRNSGNPKNPCLDHFIWKCLFVQVGCLH
jgi:hypothetical protein